jgi:hypothetical protein
MRIATWKYTAFAGKVCTQQRLKCFPYVGHLTLKFIGKYVICFYGADVIQDIFLLECLNNLIILLSITSPKCA